MIIEFIKENNKLGFTDEPKYETLKEILKNKLFKKSAVLEEEEKKIEMLVEPNLSRSLSAPNS